MFKDSQKHVTVRLFDLKLNDSTKEIETTPRLIKVERTVPSSRFNVQSGLWVRILEKALAAGGFKKESRFEKKSYAQIEGGTIHKAMMILAGGQAEYYHHTFAIEGEQINQLGSAVFSNYVVTGYESNGNPKLADLPWNDKDKEAYQDAFFSDKKYNNTLSFKIINEELNDEEATNKFVEEWMHYVYSGSIHRMLKSEFSGDYNGQIHIEDFEQLFGLITNRTEDIDSNWTARDQLNPKIARIMVAWLKKENLYPGQKGSGLYSNLQLEAFRKIEEALKKGKIVGLSTKEKVGRTGRRLWVQRERRNI